MALGFSSGVTHFYWIILAAAFNFSKISKTNLEASVEIYKVISSATLLVFSSCFLNRPLIDSRPFVLSAEIPWPWMTLNVFLNLPKIKSVTDFIQNICLSPFFRNLKVFIFTRKQLLSPSLISWTKLTECYSKLLPTNFATCLLFFCTFYERIITGVFKKVYVILLCNIWICSFFNVVSSRSHYL